MRIIVVGAGPTGLFTAVALARRGHHVLVLDRDNGPSSLGHWPRRSVMQFEHAHTFRGPVVDALTSEIPDALRDMRHAGADIVVAADGEPLALRIRRMTFERVLRDIAARQADLTLLPGHNVKALMHAGGRVVGVQTRTERLTADLVVDASGRSGRVTRHLLGPGEGGPCAAMYVTRQFRLKTGSGPMNSPVGLSLSLEGYFAVAFVHEDRHFSITLTHGGTDRRLQLLREPAVFEVAVRAIPALSVWAEPGRAEPVSAVLPGGRLYNTYRSQVAADGRPCAPGLIAVGDSVCTTTPLAGRGVTLAFLQARALVDILVEHHYDIDTAAIDFDRWCRTHVRPWFTDHVRTDNDRIRRWAGGDVHLDRPLPSDLVVAAAAVDPVLRPAVSAYERMSALPSSLDAVQERARSVYATGWRPPSASGPTAAELAVLCQTVGGSELPAAWCATGQERCPA
ncbi:NAD(P)/FAD-dependent oxidoreductase [Mycobacterium sp. SMC-4]|uniref:FAD-dependent oxidoreductase n=1 Tax=Mycobacterium sp. SMC-4 TaxID=2857059 RepID=UPI0021B222C1|nr:FAD-dependent oxidoreductase [Mycobacterium sp. SMC-4]UXA16013.1 FAD-dependent oxidoreductase [Mycobacterium sp. SMC-4]